MSRRFLNPATWFASNKPHVGPPNQYKEPPAGTVATFGLGCFWASEALIGSIKGVVRTKIGHIGGVQCVEFEFDHNVVKFDDLLKFFWEYRDHHQTHKSDLKSVIYYHSKDQEKAARKSMEGADHDHSGAIKTEVLPAGTFTDAPDFHQKHYFRNNRQIFDELNLTGAEIKESHRASRINAWLGGHGTKAQIEEEYANLGLTPAQADYLKGEIHRTAPHC